MNKSLLFIMESAGKKTNKSSDSVYIKQCLKKLYIVNNKTNIKYFDMGGISRYKSSDVFREIKAFRRNDPETKIIYCIDTDNYDSNPQQKALFNEIKSYCKDNNYDLVFFCRDIEHVFTGEQVKPYDKRKCAVDFVRNKKIEHVDIGLISSNVIADKHSNLMLVLDKYLERKP